MQLSISVKFEDPRATMSTESARELRKELLREFSKEAFQKRLSLGQPEIFLGKKDLNEQGLADIVHIISVVGTAIDNAATIIDIIHKYYPHLKPILRELPALTPVTTEIILFISDITKVIQANPIMRRTRSATITVSCGNGSKKISVNTSMTVEQIIELSTRLAKELNCE